MNLFFELKPEAAAARGHPYWALYDWGYEGTAEDLIVNSEFIDLTQNSTRVWEETEDGGVRLFKYAIDDEEIMPPDRPDVDMAEFVMVKLRCRIAG